MMLECDCMKKETTGYPCSVCNLFLCLTVGPISKRPNTEFNPPKSGFDSLRLLILAGRLYFQYQNPNTYSKQEGPERTSHILTDTAG